MYIKKVFGHLCLDGLQNDCEKGLLDTYAPPTFESQNFNNWIAELDLRTCTKCRERHGKIFSINEIPDTEPPLHQNCRCEIKKMEAIVVGEATKDGNNGADWWLKNYGVLPDYYVTDEEAKKQGWKQGKSPAKYLPDTMITMGEYLNEDNHLPDAPGRIWYEADINYYEGRRNRHRILWSNDGLIFVTYDHYETFYEVV